MDMQQVLVKEIQKLHDSETQFSKALPFLATKVQDPELRKELESHGSMTQEHIRRIETVCRELGCNPVGEPCRVTRTLIEETEKTLKNMPPSPVTDAYIVGATQMGEHLEISSYGTFAEVASSLGHPKVRDLFTQTLEEERRADQKLTTLAKARINKAAAQKVGGQATVR